jgi:O-antigen ligase
MKKVRQFFSQFNILQWSAIFFSISFGFGIAINSIGFLLFCTIGLLYSVLDYRNKKISFKKNTLLFVLLGYFLLILFRELAVNISTAPEIVFNHLAFLFIPLILLFQSKKLSKHVELLLIAFLGAMVMNALVNLGVGVYRGVLIRENGVSFWYFTYNFLSEPFGIQPIYLGFFYVIALLILFHVKIYIKNSIFFYSILTILVLSVFLLAARNAILCMLILVPFYLFLSKKISIKKGLLLLIVFTICFIGALQNPVVKNRILKVANKGNLYSGSSLRSNIWQSALSASNENFIWGSGEKKASLLLFQEFEKRDLKVPLKYKYHSHNQFLHTLIQYGAVGMVVLIILFIISIWTTYKDRNYLGLCLTLLFLFTMMTEAIFTRQWGEFSYVYFTSLVILNLPNTKK